MAISIDIHENFVSMFNTFDQKVILDATEFFCKYLGLDKTSARIYMTPLHYIHEHTYVMGSCSMKNNDLFVEFIGLAKKANRNLAAVLTTIAHEFIHLKQFIFENLDEAFQANQKAGPNKVDYYDTWWEKEAYGRQEELVLAFINSI